MKLFRFFTSKNFLPILIVFFFGVLASRTLLFQDGYFNMHDDLQMMRQLQLEKCFLDGQIPCRWVPDMGYGYGFPLFNFYPPLPYLVGEIYRVLGFSFVDTAKLLFATSIILSGIFMYLFSKQFFGRIGGVVSGVFYIWAPYHAVDVYVRGAMNESWALVFFPLICWAAYKLINSKSEYRNPKQSQNQNEENSKRLKPSKFGHLNLFRASNLEFRIWDDLKWIIVLALSYFGLFTSHNLMLMIFTPIFGVWVLIQLWQHNAWRKIPSLLIAGIWSLGLSAFFTFPAVFENKFTQLAGQLVGYYDYTGHFVTIQQLLFTQFWGYGPSVWLEYDGMSFQIGYVHWILSLVVGVLLLARLLVIAREHRSRGNLLTENGDHSKDHNANARADSFIYRIKSDKLLLTTFFMLLVGWLAAFLTHSKSTPIWIFVHQLAYLQFSWRFLALVIFAFGFAIGAIPGVVADWKSHQKWYARLAATPPQILVSIIIVLSAVIFAWQYFLPEGGKMGKLTDSDKFTAIAWDMQQTAGIYDYLPATAKKAPNMPQKALAEVVDGDGAISGASQGSYWGLFNVKVETDEALVRINIFDFPGWKVYANEKEVTHFIPNEEEWGRMYVVLPKGEHRVYAQFLNTPVRTWSNIISLVSWGLLIGALVFRKRLSDD